jgi:hypothetical protein
MSIFVRRQYPIPPAEARHPRLSALNGCASALCGALHADLVRRQYRIPPAEARHARPMAR